MASLIHNNSKLKTSMRPKDIKIKKTSHQGGFALVVALALMGFVLILLISFTTLVQVETNSASQQKAITQARSNAQLGIMVALGDLQIHTGPDQRVTAEADIISATGFYGEDRHSSRKHYVGVYSTEDWHTRDSNGIRKSWKPYDPSRNTEAFQRWLVSGPETQTEDLDLATVAPLQDEVIQILGKGTVGDTDSEDLVYVPYEEIKVDNSTVGHMAYWIGDEGIKARVNLADNRPGSSQPEWTNRRERANPPQMGIENVNGLENIFNGLSETQKQQSLYKLQTQDQTALFNNQAVAEDTLKSRYHDLTTYSRGVLADVALGGLKRDLSLPFELPNDSPPQNASDWTYSLTSGESPSDRDESYTTMWEFNNSGDRRSKWKNEFRPTAYRPDWWAKKIGYVYGYPGGNGTDKTGKRRYLRGTNWDMLRNHYRLYKRELEELPASDPSRRFTRDPSSDRTWLARSYEPASTLTASGNQTPLTMTYVGEWGDSTVNNPDPSNSLLDPFYTYALAAGVDRHWNNRGLDSLGLSPILTRMTLVIGTYGVDTNNNSEIDRVVFTVDAVGTLWNPYNVPIEVESVFSDINLGGLTMVARASGASGGWPINLPFSRLRIGVTEETDPNYPFVTTPPSKLIRLEPGELRTYTLNFPEPRDYFAGVQKIPGSFANNNWVGGIFGQYSNRRVPSTTQLQFTCTANNNPLWVHNYIGYFRNPNGSIVNPFNSSNFYGLPQINGILVPDTTDIGGSITKFVTLSLNPVGTVPNKTALMKLDFKLRASDEMDSSSDGIAREFDPRSIVNHYKASGNSSAGKIPSNWIVSMEPISDYDEVQIGVDTSGSGRNNGFWGNSHLGDGASRVVYFEVPDAPIASLAALQHCQTSPAVWDQPYAIGNSFAHKKLDQDEIFELVTEPVSFGNAFENVYHDSSYLLNEALWDRYYFTGFSFDTAVNPNNSLNEAEKIMTQFLDANEENPLGNRRLSLAQTDGSQPPIEELTHYRWIAKHLMLDGAFNINSTRKEAWKAWLSSLKGVEVDKVNTDNGSLTTVIESDSLASRSIVVAGNDGEEWSGYSKLSDAEIDTLAENIVLEVKRRGPFLSIADFINRRLSTDDIGEEGALQAALRASSLDIGSGSEEGIPGTIRQGDLLAGLGSSIAARSDTFVIRAYGAAVSPLGGTVTAESWCEAIVQRMPTLKNDNDELFLKPNESFPGTDPSRTDLYIENPDISEAAKLLGREYRIVSFRWLNEDEV